MYNFHSWKTDFNTILQLPDEQIFVLSLKFRYACLFRVITKSVKKHHICLPHLRSEVTEHNDNGLQNTPKRRQYFPLSKTLIRDNWRRWDQKLDTCIYLTASESIAYDVDINVFILLHCRATTCLPLKIIEMKSLILRKRISST